MKTSKIGVLSKNEIRERVIAIAKGELKPTIDDPKIYIESKYYD